MRPPLAAGAGVLVRLAIAFSIAAPAALPAGDPPEGSGSESATNPAPPPESQGDSAGGGQPQDGDPSPSQPAPEGEPAPTGDPGQPSQPDGGSDPAPATQPAPAEPSPGPGSPPAPTPGEQGSPALAVAPAPVAMGDLWLTQIPAVLSQRHVSYQRELAVTGFLPSRQAGVALALIFRPRGGHWRPLAWGRTGEGGAYRLAGPAARSGQLRVIVLGSDGDRRVGRGSAVHRIVVRPALRARGRRGNLLWARPDRVRGRLIGGIAGKRVVLQRRHASRWRTVARARTRPGGWYALRYMPHAPGPLRLRVRFAGDRDLAATDAPVVWKGLRARTSFLGRVRLAAGANGAGRPLTAQMTRFAQLMAGVYRAPLVITAGTNHSEWTTAGTVSDHWSGNAADFGMSANHGVADGVVGDRIAAAALIVAGVPFREAIGRARAGGLMSVVRNGLRVQVIWKTGAGGNHHGHVHVGIRRVG